MFVAYLERFLKSNNIKIDKATEKYVSFMGKNCSIRVWHEKEGRVEIRQPNKKVKWFKFNEKKIKKYLM